jgi:5-methylcytosine-specific restriction endonuclease McrA
MTAFVVLAGVLMGGAIALAIRTGRSSRTAPERAPWSDGSRGEPVPDRVRCRVWQRDRGACVVCGTRDALRFERIITAGRGGGSNSARNLELRCSSCQRLKARPDETQRSHPFSSLLTATGEISGLLKARGDS